MKRLIHLLLAGCMVLTLLAPAQAAGGRKPDREEVLEALAAYKTYLDDHSDGMNDYRMQYRRMYDEEAKLFWLSDVDGDRVPELLVFHPSDGETGPDGHWTGLSLQLRVVDYEDGEAEIRLQRDQIIVGAGGGTQFVLFGTKDPDRFLLAVRHGEGESWGFQVDSLEFGRRGYDLEPRLSFEGKYDDLGPTLTYFVGTKEATAEDFNDAYADCLREAETCILWNGHDRWDESLFWGSDPDPVAVRAIELPKVAFGPSGLEQYRLSIMDDFVPVLSDERAETILSALGSREYLFTSGAGGWQDGFELANSGSLVGTYFDYEMGDPDPVLGTMGTVYYCDYNGKLENLRQVGPHCYSADLEASTVEKPGEVSVSPEDAAMKRVSTDLKGLGNTEKVLLYTPGAEVTEELKSWPMPEPPQTITAGGRTIELLTTAAIVNPDGHGVFFAQDPVGEIPGEFWPRLVEQGGTSMLLREELLETDPALWQDELARLCAMLSRATEKGEAETRHLLDQMGVLGRRTQHLRSDHSLGACVASQIMYLDGEETNVLYVAVRGTETMWEGGRDVTMRPNKKFWKKYKAYDLPYCFYLQVEDLVEDFLNQMEHRDPDFLDRPFKVVVTGHSLGGACANLVGADFLLNDFRQKRVDPEDLFVYTFGSIDSLGKDKSYDLPIREGFENFHNVYNVMDSFGPNGNWHPVTTSGNSGVGRFGHLDLFQFDDRGDKKGLDRNMANHLMECYIKALDQGLVVHDPDKGSVPPVSKGPQETPAPREIAGYLSWTVRCPVDVEVSYQGQVIGGIYSDEEEFRESPVPLFLWTTEDTKRIIAPEDCTLRIQARDKGEMTVELHRWDEDGEEYQDSIFEDVELEPGMEFAPAPAGADGAEKTTLQVMEGDEVVSTIESDRPLPGWLPPMKLVIPAAAGLVVLLVVVGLIHKRR